MLQLENFNLAISDKTHVTIGTFDGVHLGHQALLTQMVRSAHSSSSKAIVVTFQPHPAVFFGRRSGNINLSTSNERASYLERLGVDVLVSQIFDQSLANTTAKNYVLQLKNSVNMTELWVGHDFALGRDREGDIDTLQTYGHELGFKVQLIKPHYIGAEVVSSSLIRKYLWEGNVSQAGILLGRQYSLKGQVVLGDQRGRTIGVPTANLAVPSEKLIPARGVYACNAIIDGKKMLAATNIGVRPTFDGNEVIHIETHVVDFHGDLYGQEIEIEFLEYLRGEKKFASVSELITQIHLDIEAVRNFNLE